MTLSKGCDPKGKGGWRLAPASISGSGGSSELTDLRIAERKNQAIKQRSQFVDGMFVLLSIAFHSAPPIAVTTTSGAEAPRFPRLYGTAEEVAEKVRVDVIPKPDALYRTEESALFSAAREKSRSLATLGMTLQISFSAACEVVP